MLKRVARKAVHVLRSLLEEPDGRGPLDSWAGPYTSNTTYSKFMSQPGCGHDYTWGVLHGVKLAKALDVGRVSVIEFGVAGGNGLVALERIAEQAESTFGVKVDVYGFDTGTGLPEVTDYRDMPNLWSKGFFPMDVDKLKARLSRAHLVLGPVAKTVPEFVRAGMPPVAFVAFDVDLYSSTIQALRTFDADEQFLLPRVHCYFDDILGYTFGDHVGERLAISEFNSAHALRKLSPIYGLRHYVPRRHAHRMWEKYYMAHFFDHVAYGRHDGSIPVGMDMLALHDLATMPARATGPARNLQGAEERSRAG
jgi:hypothetical protein